MKNQKTAEFKEFVRHPYTWPGCYPLFAIMADGGCICKKCATDNAKLILSATRQNWDKSWKFETAEVNWESVIYCDNCGDLIESAYEIQEI
jgi:hypothetical protein